MDDDLEPPWDEHDWERFLQQQDRKTEQYMELLEEYIDDPDRDRIIAREMGWTHLAGEHGESWEEELEAKVESELARSEAAEAPWDDSEAHSFESHPIYQHAFSLAIWWRELLELRGPTFQQNPTALAVTTQISIATSKLAPALMDDDVDEIGMTIAYLKRALKAVTLSLNAAAELRGSGLLPAEQSDSLTSGLFQIRDGIIRLMGEQRAEFRRRHGDA